MFAGKWLGNFICRYGNWACVRGVRAGGAGESAEVRGWNIPSGKLPAVLQGAAKLATGDPSTLTEFGHLMETFVVGELRKQASWLADPVTLGHWRTSDDVEVDVVVERDDGGVVGFEVKTA